MRFETDYSLKSENSFGFDLKARYWGRARSVDDIREALNFCDTRSIPLLPLGEGSNVVLAEDYPGLVLKIAITGVEITSQNEESVWVRVGAGEHWHTLVKWTLENNLNGLENLALIPGSAGAAPIQNIGAYGVELESVFSDLEAISRDSGKIRRFTPAECAFGYRNSVFKGALRNKYIITHIKLCLTRKPNLVTGYGEIEAELAAMGNSDPDANSVARAVMAIRKRKLPDPEEIGNAGSFFKNPILSQQQYSRLQSRFPEIAGYPDNGSVKIAAGWLIEQCGWKGYRKGDAGVHDKQSLVLVNHGNASASEVLELAQQVSDSVEAKFGIRLEVEPAIYGASSLL